MATIEDYKNDLKNFIKYFTTNKPLEEVEHQQSVFDKNFKKVVDNLKHKTKTYGDNKIKRVLNYALTNDTVNVDNLIEVLSSIKDYYFLENISNELNNLKKLKIFEQNISNREHKVDYFSRNDIINNIALWEYTGYRFPFEFRLLNDISALHNDLEDSDKYSGYDVKIVKKSNKPKISKLISNNSVNIDKYRSSLLSNKSDENERFSLDEVNSIFSTMLSYLNKLIELDREVNFLVNDDKLNSLDKDTPDVYLKANREYLDRFLKYFLESQEVSKIRDDYYNLYYDHFAEYLYDALISKEKNKIIKDNKDKIISNLSLEFINNPISPDDIFNVSTTIELDNYLKTLVESISYSGENLFRITGNTLAKANNNIIRCLESSLSEFKNFKFEDEYLADTIVHLFFINMYRMVSDRITKDLVISKIKEFNNLNKQASKLFNFKKIAKELKLDASKIPIDYFRF